MWYVQVSFLLFCHSSQPESFKELISFACGGLKYMHNTLFVKCIKYSIYDIAHSLVHFQLTLLYTHFLYLPIFTIHSILSPYIAILSENVIVSYYAIPCAFTHAFLNVHRTTGIQVKVSMKFISKLLVSISSRLRETQFILRSCWGRDSLERCTGDGGIMGSAWWRWQ